MGLGDRAVEQFIDAIYKHDEMNAQDEEARKLIDKLGIPREGNNVHVFDLYNILMDEEKLRKIVSYMNNKMIW